MVLLLWHQIVLLWHQVTMVGIRTTFMSNNSITEKTCNRKYTWLPFCYCSLVGILFEVLRIVFYVMLLTDAPSALSLYWPFGENIKSGITTNLTCSAAKSKPASMVELSWYRNGVPIMQGITTTETPMDNQGQHTFSVKTWKKKTLRFVNFVFQDSLFKMPFRKHFHLDLSPI